MDIQKILGYALSGIGIAGILLSSENMKSAIPVLKDLSSQSILIPAGIITVAGIVLLIIAGKGSSAKQESEVPIYKGRGKNRTIVGYQRQ